MTSTGMIRAAAKRILGPMEAFKTGRAAPEGVTDVIGVYDAPGAPGPVWITATGLLVPDGSALKMLRYVQMYEILAPESKDRANPESELVKVFLAEGGTATLRILGGKGRFCDSFEFVRFLVRASKCARMPSGTQG